MIGSASSNRARSGADKRGEHGLADVVGLEDELEFVNALVARHDWSEDARRQIRDSVDKIVARDADTHLYLGVVGEFSSGKSTLINALMRTDLLKTDVLQATTAAATWMRHGPEFDVEVEFKDLERRSYRNDGIKLWQRFTDRFREVSRDTEKDRLREFIHKLTADEEVAAQLRSVTIRHPAPAFERGLVIIDTPGANAQNARHVEVAGATLRDHCDAAIVVIPADIPVSESLLGFLREHVAEILHRCLFVVTKLDTVRRPRERDRLVKTIGARIASELGLKYVHVHAIAPRVVMDEVTGEEHTLATADVRAFLDSFEHFETRAWRKLESSKSVVLLERVALLLERLLQWLPEELARYERRYAERHAALEAARIPDLALFVRERKKVHRDAFADGLADLPARAQVLVEQSRESVLAEIRAAIYGTSDKASLKPVLEQRVGQLVERHVARLRNGLKKFDGRVNHAAKEQLRAFEAEFREIYQALQTLGGALPRQKARASAGKLQNHELHRLGDSLALTNARLAASEDTEFWVGVGGAGAGALLGTLVLPVIGTAVGAALGSFIGALFGPSLQQLQDDAWRDVQQAVSATYDTIQSSARDAMKRSIRHGGSRLDAAIDQYFEQYGSLVDEMIARDVAERRELQKRREAIERDTAEIQSRASRLSAVRERLRRIGHSDDCVDPRDKVEYAT